MKEYTQLAQHMLPKYYRMLFKNPGVLARSPSCFGSQGPRPDWFSKKAPFRHCSHVPVNVLFLDRIDCDPV